VEPAGGSILSVRPGYSETGVKVIGTESVCSELVVPIRVELWGLSVERGVRQNCKPASEKPPVKHCGWTCGGGGPVCVK